MVVDVTERLSYVEAGTDVIDIDEGQFCYSRNANGSPTWVHFWPVDSICPLSASVAPQRNDIGVTWTLTGSEEAPTLSPSVHAKGVWHGFLTNGIARQ